MRPMRLQMAHLAPHAIVLRSEKAARRLEEIQARDLYVTYQGHVSTMHCYPSQLQAHRKLGYQHRLDATGLRHDETMSSTFAAA